MDHTKLRLIAAAAGLLLGLGGVLAMFVAATLGLAEVVGLPWAAFTVATAGLVLAGLCMFVCLEPFRSMDEEVDDVEEEVAEALADLPFDTIRTIIQRRPLTMITIALIFGYSLIRNPHAAQRQVERFILSVI